MSAECRPASTRDGGVEETERGGGGEVERKSRVHQRKVFSSFFSRTAECLIIGLDLSGTRRPRNVEPSAGG